MKNLISKSIIAVACAGIMISAPAYAEAPAADEEFAVPFSYKASELQSEDSAAKLLVRLERAVRAECAPADTRSQHARKLAEQCVEETMLANIAKFGSTSLAAAYEVGRDG
jgi:UrcA family protein